MTGIIGSLMKKAIAKVGIVGLVVLGISECHMITAPAVLADENQKQVLDVGQHFGFIERLMHEPRFYRLEATIDENAYPWLNPEKVAEQIDTEELKSILRKAGFEGYALRMAQAIISLESTRRPLAHNPNANTGDNSYGLFQINMFRGLEAQRLEQYNLSQNEDLFDPLTNAEVAFKISSGGTSWGAWTTYPEAKKIVGNYSS